MDFNQQRMDFYVRPNSNAICEQQRMRMTLPRTWISSLLFLSAVACSAQQAASAGLENYTRKIQLTSGLSLLTFVYNGYDSAGHRIGDYEVATNFSDVSNRGFGVSWNMTYPANQSGHGFVPYAQQSHKVSIYSRSTGGPPEGYCVYLSQHRR